MIEFTTTNEHLLKLINEAKQVQTEMMNLPKLNKETSTMEDYERFSAVHDKLQSLRASIGFWVLIVAE